MPTYYAHCRALDAVTGDVVMDGGTWKTDPPMVGVVTRVLRTQRGSYLPDPTFGVDWSKVDKLRPNVAELLRVAIMEALQRYLDRGLISSVAITASVAAGALFFAVSFLDPRQPGVRANVNGQI